MKRIINKSRKKLIFTEYDLVIDTEEIKEVSDDIAKKLFENAFIEEVIHIQQEIKNEDLLKNKGRKKKINN